MTQNKYTGSSGIFLILSIIITLLGIATYSFFFRSYFLLTNPDLPAWIPVLKSSAFFILLEGLFFLLFRKTASISFSEFLKKDCITLVPSFFLLLSLTNFLSASHFPEDKILKVMLGYVFTIIILLKAFLYFHHSFQNLIVMSISRLKKILFFSFLFFFVLFSFWTLTAIGPTGDEPMYLVQTLSISKNHTFDITNILINGDYSVFYDGNLPIKEYLIPGKPSYFGARYLGLPLLILPGFIAAGKYGAGFIMAIIASLFAVNIFLLIEDSLKKRKISLLAAIAAAFSMPLIFFSSRIYPDLPASLLLLYAFRKITKEGAKPADMLLAGLAAAYLPWLHPKFALSAATVSVIALLINIKKVKNIFTFLPLPAISALIYLPFLHSSAGENYSSFFTWKVYKYSLALFFDGEGGLLWFSPFFILSLTGAYFYFRKKEKFRIPILIVIVPILILLGGFKSFQGGYGLARPLIPLLPFLTLFAAAYMANSKSTKGFCFFAAPGFILSMLLTGIPWLILNNRNGNNIFLEFIDKYFKINISGILPTFEFITIKSYFLTFLYAGIFIAISIYLTNNRKNESLKGEKKL